MKNWTERGYLEERFLVHASCTLPAHWYLTPPRQEYTTTNYTISRHSIIASKTWPVLQLLFFATGDTSSAWSIRLRTWSFDHSDPVSPKNQSRTCDLSMFHISIRCIGIHTPWNGAPSWTKLSLFQSAKSTPYTITTVSHISALCNLMYPLRVYPHRIELNCATLTAFVHPGLAHLSFVLLLYLRSSRNWCFCDNFEKSGGHSLFAL